MKHLSKRVLAVVGLGAVIAAGAVTANAVSATTGTDGFTQVTQTRVFDSGRIDGDALLASGHSQTIDPNAVTAGLVPAGATAVEIQITAASETEANGDLDVTPTTVDAPGTSNLNYTEGVAITSSATATLGPDGTFSVYNHGGTAGDLRLIVDVLGYYAPTAIYTPPTAVTASLNVPAAGEAITTGGTYKTYATAIGTITFPVAGTYQVDTSFVATPDEQTSGNVFPQLLFLGNFNVGGAAIEDAGPGSVQNPMNADVINSSISGTDTVTVTAGEVITIDAFGYDSDTGAGSYWLTNPQVTAIPLNIATS